MPTEEGQRNGERVAQSHTMSPGRRRWNPMKYCVQIATHMYSRDKMPHQCFEPQLFLSSVIIMILNQIEQKKGVVQWSIKRS